MFRRNQDQTGNNTAKIKDAITGYLTSFADDPELVVPVAAFRPYEFLAFSECLGVAVESFVSLNATVGPGAEELASAVVDSGDPNADLVAGLINDVQQIASGNGANVVFRPAADAADTAAALLSIAALGVARIARNTNTTTTTVAEGVVNRWMTHPVIHRLAAGAAVLATSAEPDSPCPCGSGRQYRKCCIELNTDTLFKGAPPVNLSPVATVLVEALPVAFAGISGPMPFVGLDSTQRPELPAFADKMTGQAEAGDPLSCRVWFDAIPEPQAPVIVGSFAWGNEDSGDVQAVNVMFPYGPGQPQEFMRYIAKAGGVVLMFRDDGGLFQPESPLSEPGIMVVEFDRIQLEDACDLMDLAVPAVVR